MLAATGRIPEHGLDRDELAASLGTLKDGDADWHAGRTWSLVYHASDEHSAFLKKVFTTFFSENGLNPLAFQSLRRFEAEVVRMTLNLLNGDEHSAGTMSSGGSESIFLAVKTYRSWARAIRPEITSPELVLPVSAHPAFDKACHYLDVTPVKVDVADDFRVDVDAVRAAVTDNTIALVGSAPGYPHGVIDPIGALGEIAQEHEIGLHVDGCLGGFLLPWAERLGRDIPPFDFRVPGVTSMSADVHKYAFAAKGASTILYRSADLREHQFYARTGWSGGLYASPTAAGTRPGGAIAAAWAALKAFGEDGYLDLFRGVLDTTDRLTAGIAEIDGIEVLGDPPASVFAVGSSADDVDVFAVGDALERRDWHVDRQIRPDALHFMVTPVHEPVVDEFLSDLADSVDEVRGRPELSTEGQAAMYGMMAAVPPGGEDELETFVIQMLGALYDLDEVDAAD